MTRLRSLLSALPSLLGYAGLRVALAGLDLASAVVRAGAWSRWMVGRPEPRRAPPAHPCGECGKPACRLSYVESFGYVCAECQVSIADDHQGDSLAAVFEPQGVGESVPEPSRADRVRARIAAMTPAERERAWSRIVAFASQPDGEEPPDPLTDAGQRRDEAALARLRHLRAKDSDRDDPLTAEEREELWAREVGR